MTLSEQMSIRLTMEQRQFIRAKLKELRKNLPQAKIREADVVRAYIQQAVAEGRDPIVEITGGDE